MRYIRMNDLTISLVATLFRNRHKKSRSVTWSFLPGVTCGLGIRHAFFKEPHILELQIRRTKKQWLRCIVRVAFSKPSHAARARIRPPGANHDPFTLKPSSYHVHSTLRVTPPTSLSHLFCWCRTCVPACRGYLFCIVRSMTVSKVHNRV